MKIIRKSINKRRRAPVRPGAPPPIPDVNSEIAVWKKLKHPFIVKLFEVIDDEKSDKLYLIGELVNGGALMPDSLTAEALPVEKVRRYFCMLIDAIYYLHFNDIVHRDIKPGNILLDNDTDVIKLSDFGVSQVTQAGDSFRNTAGTAAFLAPEMLTGDFFSAKKQDIWACGITLFMMVYGKTPFAAESVPDTYANIKLGTIVFPKHTTSNVQIDPESVDEVNDLITHLLDPNPETRFSLEETRAHPFLQAVEPLFNLLPSKRIIVTEEEVSAAVTTVHHIRSVVTAAIVGKRSLTAARMRIALKKASAVSAFDTSPSTSAPSSPSASPLFSSLPEPSMSTLDRVEAFAGVMSTSDRASIESDTSSVCSISSAEDPALHEKSNSSISSNERSNSSVSSIECSNSHTMSTQESIESRKSGSTISV
jgi:[calcium/calmodulin-dependent protein kinase] kinase